MGRKAINERREAGVDAKLLREKPVQENDTHARTHLRVWRCGTRCRDSVSSSLIVQFRARFQTPHSITITLLFTRMVALIRVLVQWFVVNRFSDALQNDAG